MFPRVSIIILNWNGWRDTIECLESLYRITYPNYDVIVVDNDSQDDSVQKIKGYTEGKIRGDFKFFEYNPNNKPIEVFEISENDARQGKFNRPLYEKFDPNRRMILIKNKDNYGFAGGNNVGIKFALSVLNPDYILLLNNDTVVDPKFLDELVKVAENDENIGIVGSKVYYYDYKGRSDILQSAGGKFNFWISRAFIIGINKPDDGRYDSIMNVDYVAGACMLIKKEVFSEIGLLNPEYFLYREEIDTSTRASKKGFKSVYVPTAKIWHKVSASIKQISTMREYYFTRNRIIFIRRHKSKKYLISLLAYDFGFHFWITILHYIKSGKPTGIKWYLKAIWDGLSYPLPFINGVKFK